MSEVKPKMKTKKKPSSLDLPREAMKRDWAVMVLVFPDEFQAIDEACDTMNCSRSSLLYEMLRIQTNGFTNFSVPEGTVLRRRKRET